MVWVFAGCLRNVEGSREEIVAIFAENERFRDGWIERKDLEKISVLHVGRSCLGLGERDDGWGRRNRISGNYLVLFIEHTRDTGKPLPERYYWVKQVGTHQRVCPNILYGVHFI